MSDDPKDFQLEEALEALRSGADSAGFTVTAATVRKVAPARLQHMLNGLWTEGTRYVDLLSAAEKGGAENFPNSMTLQSETGPIPTDEGWAKVRLTLTIEVGEEHEEEE